MKDFLIKIKEFILKYEQKIVLIVALCLISAISFEFGVLEGQKWQQKPLIVEKPTDISNDANSSNLANSEALATTGSAITQASKPSNCAYVGSKSSNKFYLPSCSYAKRIKPENMVCFKSAQEALEQGRTESKCK